MAFAALFTENTMRAYIRQFLFSSNHPNPSSDYQLPSSSKKSYPYMDWFCLWTRGFVHFLQSCREKFFTSPQAASGIINSSAKKAGTVQYYPACGTRFFTSGWCVCRSVPVYYVSFFQIHFLFFLLQKVMYSTGIEWHFFCLHHYYIYYIDAGTNAPAANCAPCRTL